MDQATKAPEAFDRTAEDVGNIVEFGHVNVRVPDQRLATLFYVSGLGPTRDPVPGDRVENMWINVGTSQFHSDPPGAGGARARGLGRAGFASTAVAARAGAPAFAGHAVHRRGRATESWIPPVPGQPHPLPRAGAPAGIDGAWHSVCRARGTAGHGRTDCALLSRGARRPRRHR